MVGYLFSFGKVIVLVSLGFWVLHRVHFRYLKFQQFAWGASNSLILHKSGFSWDVLWFFTGCNFV